MIELPQTLPAGALIAPDLDALHQTLAAAGGMWLSGAEAHFRFDEDGRLRDWRARLAPQPEAYALPVAPNEGNGDLAYLGDLTGLALKAETHCGMVVDHAVPDGARFSMAVIYLPDPKDQSRTLLTMNTGKEGGKEGGGNYLFLSDTGGEITVKDTRGAVTLTAPIHGGLDAPRMAIVTLWGRQLALSLGASPAVSMVTGEDPQMGGPADLFIGCRSHRKGLHKTLGGAVILDVFCLPDIDLLLAPDARGAGIARALRQHFLWGF